jgi:opacity protein-like surface antigen
MRRIAPVLFAALMWSPSPAVAQSVAQPKTWTVTPFIDLAVGTNAPTGSGGIGAAVGYDLTSNLGVEGELGRLFDVSGDDENIDWSVTSFSGNVIYHFDVVRVTPYATVGLGFSRSSVHVDHPDPVALVQPSSTEVTVNFGGGVKYPISDRLLARADLRRFQANDLAPDYWRIYGGLTFVIR